MVAANGDSLKNKESATFPFEGLVSMEGHRISHAYLLMTKLCVTGTLFLPGCLECYQPFPPFQQHWGVCLCQPVPTCWLFSLEASRFCLGPH